MEYSDYKNVSDLLGKIIHWGHVEGMTLGIGEINPVVVKNSKITNIVTVKTENLLNPEKDKYEIDIITEEGSLKNMNCLSQSISLEKDKTIEYCESRSEKVSIEI